MNSQSLDDALQIWRAGVAAVDSSRLVEQSVHIDGTELMISGRRWDSTSGGRICVVGAGKAGAGMAAGLEHALPEFLLSRTSGWVNVPEDCVRTLERIHLHGARPAGVNEPTSAGAAGTQEILERLKSLTPADLCVVLISGGGSALLPAPVEGISLQSKLDVTRLMMESGATIHEMNAVRRELSAVKGGGLLRACRSGMLISLIISDVIGDPLETIASGPTVDIPRDPQKAIDILTSIEQRTGRSVPAAVFEVLKRQLDEDTTRKPVTIDYTNSIIGNNRTAVDEAAIAARNMGYEVIRQDHDQGGIAREFGEAFAEESLRASQNRSSGEKLCLLSGGEPVVQLVSTNQERKGGRNQEVVLAAAKVMQREACRNVTLLSGGTDGEDGPTDAAGAIINSELLDRAKSSGLDIDSFLEINNSYPFFEQIGGLIKSGPTHTNVMDLRVSLIHDEDAADHTL